MYQYTLSGLKNVYLKNGYTIKETPSGKSVSIHDINGLHKTIAKRIVEADAHLTGDELRFLRVEMDLSQKALGDLLGKSDQAVAKWEKGDTAIPNIADKAIRDLYMESIGESHVAGLLQKLAQLDRDIIEIQISLEETQEGWKEAC